jgi:hypothetical protein
VLGVVWLLDAGLQLQSYMFTRAFSSDLIAGAAAGQAGFVSAPVLRAAAIIGAHPLPWNALFALIQCAIGVGLLSGRATKPALVASMVWASSVWYLGEGLGGITGGSAWLLIGAPGAALVYVVLSAAGWPTRQTEMPPRWLTLAWASYWVGGALLQLRNGPTRGPELAANVAGAANGAPGWVSRLDFSLARNLNARSHVEILLLVVVQAIIGLAVFGPRLASAIALVFGAVVATGLWVVGQGLGQLTSGHATDLNIGPLIVLLAAATHASETRRYGRANTVPVVGRRTARAGRYRRALS